MFPGCPFIVAAWPAFCKAEIPNYRAEGRGRHTLADPEEGGVIRILPGNFAFTLPGPAYVHFAGNFLRAGHPQLNLNIVNSGVSGDTLLDLKERWERDCLAHRPNVLSVLIGINDVWQLTMQPDLAETAASPEEYELTYDQLLARAKEQCNCRPVLMEPFMFCRDRNDRVFQALMPYVEIVRRSAARHDAVMVFLQREIDRHIAEVPPPRWSEDAVHPYLWAHAWIAQRRLEATGLWPRNAP